MYLLYYGRQGVRSSVQLCDTINDLALPAQHEDGGPPMYLVLTHLIRPSLLP